MRRAGLRLSFPQQSKGMSVCGALATYTAALDFSADRINVFSIFLPICSDGARVQVCVAAAPQASSDATNATDAASVALVWRYRFPCKTKVMGVRGGLRATQPRSTSSAHRIHASN